MIRLPIAEIRMDATLQPRTLVDTLTITEYSERMIDGDAFPPVVVFYDGTDHWLADGYHRVYAAREAGQTHIPVKILRGDREAAQWYSFSANKVHGLPRTKQDKKRAVEAALAHPNAANLSNPEIAKHCGVSHDMVRTYRNALRRLTSDFRDDVQEMIADAQEFADLRNGSNPPEPEPIVIVNGFGEPLGEVFDVSELPMPARHIYSHTYWNTLSEEKQNDLIYQGAHIPQHGQLNEQNQDNIEWARWSWNPVTGCYHDCIYCYARDIANRFYEQKFDATFLPERLSVPRYTMPPADADHLVGYKNIFTCSMADLFGKWVPQNWIDAVLDTVVNSPQWNFLFLTKFPIRLSEQTWPDNAWVGCTVDSQPRVASAERAFSKVKAGVKWLSCEPLLTPLKFTSLAMFDWVVIGGQSRSSLAPEFQPQWEWVASLEDQARAAGCKVYYKTNLLVRPKEYPGA